MKKVLMVSYYWPPAGGVSVLRTLKIAKYLRKFGWEPIIFTTTGAHYPYLDKGNLEDIPKGIEVIKRPILEPFVVFKQLSGRKKEEKLDNILQVRSEKTNFFNELGIWVRANFFIPDARALWIRPSVKYLNKYLKTNKVDAIFSDGPPHTNTVIANKVAKKFNIPWLADFQDPWTQADYYEMFPVSRIAHRIHSKMEQSVFENANKITIASPSWKADLESIGAKNVDVIYYGYDEDDFTDVVANKAEKEFVISHAGLLGVDRFPNKFFAAIKELIDEGKIDKSNILIKLVGQVDWMIKDDLSKMGLDDIVTYNGFIPRKDVLKLNADSDLLLLPLNQAKNTKGRLPGKLYEYLRSGTEIVSFGPLDSDAANIISECKAGSCFEYSDQQGMKDYIVNLLSKKRLAKPKISESVEAFSNYNQTKLVADYLDQIIK